jgi:hypothetical protein
MLFNSSNFFNQGVSDGQFNLAKLSPLLTKSHQH